MIVVEIGYESALSILCYLFFKGLLLRNYTQNIDCLERAAGVSANLLVECHGVYANSHVILKILT